MGTANNQTVSRRAETRARRQRERGDDGKARVADAGVEAGEARVFRCARRPPFAIFIER